MDAFIYALVLVPALTELLPRSGIAATPGNIGYYGSILLALFLLGWGLSMVWGPIADRFGRVRALMLTILFYSVFTFMCGLVTNIWQLAVLRVLCGIGLGGEQPMGGTFVAEEWPEDRRKMGAGYMHTGYYFGFFLAAIANYNIGANYGWRWMFVFGGAPALLVGWIRSGVHEPATWQKKAADERSVRGCARRSTSCSRRSTASRTIINSLLFLVSIIGLWAGSIYVPAAVTQIAVRAGCDGGRCGAHRVVRLDGAGDRHDHRLPAGAVAGRTLGRRMAMASISSSLGVAVAIGFGYVFYLPYALTPFFVLIFFLGIGGANFAMYTLWLPEQYTTECRGERDRLRQLGRPLRRRGDGVPGRRRDPVLRQPGRSGRGHGGWRSSSACSLLPFAVETRGKALPT